MHVGNAVNEARVRASWMRVRMANVAGFPFVPTRLSPRDSSRVPIRSGCLLWYCGPDESGEFTSHRYYRLVRRRARLRESPVAPVRACMRLVGDGDNFSRLALATRCQLVAHARSMAGVQALRSGSGDEAIRVHRRRRPRRHRHRHCRSRSRRCNRTGSEGQEQRDAQEKRIQVTHEVAWAHARCSHATALTYPGAGGICSLRFSNGWKSHPGRRR